MALVAILPGEPAAVRHQRDRLGLQMRVLADPTWSTHRAYGLHRGSLRQIWLSPATWLAYARLLMHGGPLRWPAGDTRQLGGDVLIDGRGRVAWVHASRHPADRPPVDEILRRISAVSPHHPSDESRR